MEAAERFRSAVDAAWPPDFFEHLARCKRGEAAGLDSLLDYVEACPRFFRTGYILSSVLHVLPRPPRSRSQAGRMRGIVLAAVGRRLRVPFRWIPSLACAVDAPEMRRELRVLVDAPDPVVRERAMAVLHRLPGGPWDAARARQKRLDDRVRAMLVTAQARRSAVLLRRVLEVDPSALSAPGRRALAVAFEFAMNWALLPNEELLQIAGRIDGEEMTSVWGFALQRSDAAGDRARWLLQQMASSDPPSDRTRWLLQHSDRHI